MISHLISIIIFFFPHLAGTFDKDDDSGKPSHKEMEHLLKRGAYALMEDEEDTMGKEFCEDDIES